MCPQRRIFFSSRRRHTRSKRDWSSDVCSSDLAVDRDDHIWAINRRVDARPDELTAATNPPRGECCVLGPEILEFDQDGNVVKIGRASCRERVEVQAGGIGSEKEVSSSAVITCD